MAVLKVSVSVSVSKSRKRRASHLQAAQVQQRLLMVLSIDEAVEAVHGVVEGVAGQRGASGLDADAPRLAQVCGVSEGQ